MRPRWTLVPGRDLDPDQVAEPDRVVPGSPFEAVLQASRRAEQDRLDRFRVRWMLAHTVVLLVSLGLLAVTGRSIVGWNATTGQGFVLVFSGPVLVGWVVAVGVVGICLLLIPFAIVRLVAMARTDDLAEFERRHAS